MAHGALNPEMRLEWPPMKAAEVDWGKVFSTGILKISVVTDKREYRIYRKFIGDRNKISEEI
jgi:hypothetical protein